VARFGLARTARLFLYAIALPPLAVAPFALKEPQRPARIAIAALFALVATARSVPRARAWLARTWDGSPLLRGIDTALWNALLFMALAECALAIAGRVSSHPLLAAPDARASWRVADVRARLRAGNPAGGMRNPGGYNDTLWVVPKAPGSRRIVALGDSFAYGIVGYERNFLTLLEPLLGERLGQPVEIANLGLPELQPGDYLHLLHQEGLALQPDAIVVCLYAGNDFDRNKLASWLTLQSYRVYEFARRVILWSAESQRRAREQAGAGATPSGAAAPPGTVLTDQPTFSPEAYQHILTGYASLLRADGDADEGTRRRIVSTLAVLDRIVALARPLPIAIAVLPSELQVDSALQDVVRAELGLARDALDLDRPFHLVADHFAGSGVLVIDLLPSIAAAHRAAPAYHPRDTHWNARGNEAATAALADALAPWLRETSAVASSAH
jgi:hypothetical protein